MAGNVHALVVYRWNSVAVEHVEIARACSAKSIFFNTFQRRGQYRHLQLAAIESSYGDSGNLYRKYHLIVCELVSGESLLPYRNQVFRQLGMPKLFATRECASANGD